MTKQFHSLGDVAELLRTTPYKIHYLLATKQVPEPRLRIGSRRIWTAEEIAPISEKLTMDKAADAQQRDNITDAPW